MRARLLVVGGEAVAQCRSDAQNAKEVCGYDVADEMLGLAASGEGEVVIVKAGQRGEGLVLGTPVKKVWIAQRVAGISASDRLAVIAGGDRHEPIGLGKR